MTCHFIPLIVILSHRTTNTRPIYAHRNGGTNTRHGLIMLILVNGENGKNRSFLPGQVVSFSQATGPPVSKARPREILAFKILESERQHGI
jgi:hypothetical protein